MNPGGVLLELERLYKVYPIERTGGQQLCNLWQRLLGRPPTHAFQALSDVNLTVCRGESVGLIGENGAGKSTLMKVIAGVARPTQGSIARTGTVAALLELGAGFHPEYTGRENVRMACALAGLSRSQTQARLASILEFADIGTHVEDPVKHYSSGMVVRLGFAVVTALRPDLLITDEVLAVGDESFQKKCMAWMASYLQGGGTLLLCSHSMYHIEKLCQRAVWLEHGRIRMNGPVFDVTRAYLAWHDAKSAATQHELADSGGKPRGESGVYQVLELELQSTGNEGDGICLQQGDDLRVCGRIHSPDGRAPNVAIGIVRSDGTAVHGVASDMDGHRLTRVNEHGFSFAITLYSLPLLPGVYSIRAHAMDPEGLRLFDQVEQTFSVRGETREMGLVHIDHAWHATSSSRPSS